MTRNAAAMLAEACLDRFVSADVAGATRVARDAGDVAAKAGPAVQARAGVMLAVGSVLTGDRAQAGAWLDRFLPLLRAADPLPRMPGSSSTGGRDTNGSRR